MGREEWRRRRWSLVLLYATVQKCYSEQSSRAQDKVTCDKLISERDVAG